MANEIKPRTTPLSKRERLFLKYLADPKVKTQTEAAIKAGYSRKAAGVIASTKLTKTKAGVGSVREPFCQIMEKAGLTDKYLIEKHFDLLNAEKVVSVIPVKKKDDPQGDPTLPDANSKSLEFVEVPDHGIRAKGLDMAYRLKGHYQDKIKLEGTIGIEDKLRKIQSER